MKQLFFIIALISGVLNGHPLSAQNTFFVKEGSTGNGSSWANAYGDLQQALASAQSNDQIWVSEGNYIPVVCTNCTETQRGVYFDIPSGVAVYGGFEGTETTVNERDFLNHPTILNGDIGTEGDSSDNSFTVVHFKNTDSNTRLDGFIIQGGNSDSSSASNFQVQQKGGGIFSEAFQALSQPTIANCIIRDNHASNGGAGLFNLAFDGDNFTQVDNCIFDSNASTLGGATHNAANTGECSPIFTNCIFKENNGSSTGGCAYNFATQVGSFINAAYTGCFFYDNYGFSCAGVYGLGSQGGAIDIQITNATFINNDANIGTAVYVNASDGGTTFIHISNTIIWNNTAGFDPIFHYSGDSNPEIHIEYSLVDAANCNSIMNGMGMINCGPGMLYNLNPQFLNLSANDAHLTTNSPALDAGTNTAINATGLLLDLDGNDRIFNSTVDLGVYEYDGGYIPATINTQPQGGTYCEGTTATLNIGVAGTGPFTYQWYINGTSIPNSNSDTYTINNLTSNNAGNYSCEVLGPQGEQLLSESTLLTINPTLPASVSVLFDNDEACQGEALTFTAQAQNGGTSPFFQWQINNEDTGITGATFSTDSLNTGDQITCTMQSSALCAQPLTSLSSPVNINILPNLVPTISITADATSICQGEMVTFSASTNNEGENPIYEWTINGELVGNNSPTQSFSTLSQADQVQCTLISSEACAVPSQGVSNVISMNVQLLVAPTIEISTNTPTACAGSNVAFTSNTSNEGTSPQYDWLINGQSSGQNGPTFTSNNLNNGDQVSCILTSNANCLSTSVTSSNAIVVTIDQPLTPSIEIQADQTTICEGTTITFNSQTMTAGNNPQFEWLINGVSTGETLPTFSSNSINNGDIVSAQLTSSESCITTSTVLSNEIEIDVNENLLPQATIAANTTSICQGETIEFTSSLLNAGDNPTTHWLLNGQIIESNTPALSLSALTNGDIISLNLTSSASCVLTNTVLSNEIPISVQTPSIVSLLIETEATTLCNGEAATLFANALNEGPNPIYEWFINDIPQNNNEAFLAIPTIANNDIVTATVQSDAYCIANPMASSNEIVFDIVDNLTPSISIVASDTTICEGTEVVFTSFIENEGSMPQLEWYINGEAIGQEETVFISNNLNPGDTVSCLLSSSASCITTAEVFSLPIEMEVLAFQEVTIDLSPTDSSVCVGSSIDILANTTATGDNPIYFWQINDTDIGNNAPHLLYEDIAFDLTITCSVLSSEMCVTNNPAQASIEIIANDLPTINLLPIDTLCQNQAPIELQAGQPSGGIYDGPFIVDGFFAPNEAGVGTFEYTYTVTDQNECTNSATGDLVVALCNNTEAIFREPVRLYPNPVSETLHIDWGASNQKVQQVICYAGNGQLVKQITPIHSFRTATLSVRDFEAGIYFIKIIFDEQVQVYSIFVE